MLSDAIEKYTLYINDTVLTRCRNLMRCLRRNLFFICSLLLEYIKYFLITGPSSESSCKCRCRFSLVYRINKDKTTFGSTQMMILNVAQHMHT